MKSEAAIQARVRLTISQAGGRLWRNNVGVAFDEYNKPVRFGLANESAKVNKLVKSSDLIGITPVLITTGLVGTVIGRFTARECKREGWTYAGSDREIAQKNFIDIVNALGGDARFTTGK